MKANGEEVEFESVLQAILQRDGRDRRRAVAPLIKPRGAIEIDTTGKTIPEVVAEMLRQIESER